MGSGMNMVLRLDHHGVDKVEVIKGPASLTYGSDALAGACEFYHLSACTGRKKWIGDVLAEYQKQTTDFMVVLLCSAAIKTGLSGWQEYRIKQQTTIKIKIGWAVFSIILHSKRLTQNVLLGLTPLMGSPLI